MRTQLFALFYAELCIVMRGYAWSGLAFQIITKSLTEPKSILKLKRRERAQYVFSYDLRYLWVPIPREKANICSKKDISKRKGKFTKTLEKSLF